MSNYEKGISYTLVVAFKRGAKKEINGVSDYIFDTSSRFVKVVKNGYFHFFNFDEILYIGRKYDLEEN